MKLLRKHKSIIVTAITVLAVLAVSFFWGGNYSRSSDNTPTVSGTVTPEALESNSEVSLQVTESPTPDISTAPQSTAPQETVLPSAGTDAPSEQPQATETAKPTETEKPTETAKSIETAKPTKTPTDPSPSDTVIYPSAVKDKYLTDPVPEGKPLPVEPQDVKVGTKPYTCTLSVRCDTILDNMKLLDKEKHELVPEDGVILAAVTVTFYEGESVFNVLRREMKRNKIHMEFVNTPIYNSAYIEGINNLYEFDVGELSGWMYKVNGWFPNYGCSRYQLKDGDIIEWVYTCDLGRDVGDQYFSTGGGGQ